MKRILIYLILGLFISSCESNEDKESRLILDKYVRKLNSLTLDIVTSRNDEGSQSQLTLNDFYLRYTEKVEGFNDNLVMEKISDKYSKKREDLSDISRTLMDYLNKRKNGIHYLSNSFSKHKEADNYQKRFDEYLEKMDVSYSLDTYYADMASGYADKAYNARLKFQYNRLDYYDQLLELSTISTEVVTQSSVYNTDLEKLKLLETLNIPIDFSNISTDWLFISKKKVESLN